MRKGRKKALPPVGQSTLEFVWLMVAIITIVIALQPFLKRAIGGRYRSSIDQVSQQHFDPRATYNYTVRSDGTRQDSVGADGRSVSTIPTDSTEVTEQSTTIGSTEELLGVTAAQGQSKVRAFIEGLDP